MYTSLVLLALTGTSVPGEAIPSAPAWIKDYRLAYRETQKQKRPLAVFLTPGSDSWGKISKDGELGKEALLLLSRNYVTVHVDTTTDSGKQLAAQFGISGRGLVLSDGSGEKQAFWHEGTLSSSDLDHYLKKYGDADRAVTTTEKVAVASAAPTPAPSYTSAPSYAAPSYQQPSYAPSYAPSFGGGYSGGSRSGFGGGFSSGGRSGGC